MKPYMNDHSYDCLNGYSRLKYNQLDEYLKAGLRKTHIAWYFYMNDIRFLNEYKDILTKDEDNKYLEMASKLTYYVFCDRVGEGDETQVMTIIIHYLLYNIANQQYN